LSNVFEHIKQLFLGTCSCIFYISNSE